MKGAFKVGDRFTLVVTDDDSDTSYPLRVQDVEDGGDLLVDMPSGAGGIHRTLPRNSVVECASFLSSGRYILRAVVAGHEFIAGTSVECMRLRPSRDVERLQLREAFRVSARRNCTIKWSLTDAATGEETVQCEDAFTNDISTGGIQLITKREYPSGAQFKIELHLEFPNPGHPPLELLGVVRSCREAQGLRMCFIIGIQFLTDKGKPLSQESPQSQILFRFIRREELQQIRINSTL
jgi:c-di-GMP-binding flagellar brake protein YcgR